jgi:hypothetical protein
VLSCQRLLSDAERATRLNDWGADDYRARLERLVDSINSQAELHAAGLRAAQHRLHDVLCGRLRLVEDRKRFPGIAAERIERPLFVIGLPRAGTTFLHNLLAQDPRARSPMTWEILFPSPPPERSSYDTDPRIEQCKTALAAQGFRGAELQSIHPFDAERPEECNFIWEFSLQTVNFPAFWNIPDYAAYLGTVDFRRVYREHRQFLQHLQHRFRAERWVLKSPAHNMWLEELLDVYPDASLVVCHRDPARVLPSLSSNLVALRRTFSDLVPEGEFGMLEQQAASLRRVAAVRARPEYRQRFIDAHYLDVQADPLAVVRRIYAHFDLSLDEASLAAMRAWLERDRSAHARGHRHSYRLEDYGLDLARIDRVMGEYIRDSGVTLERRGAA